MKILFSVFIVIIAIVSVSGQETAPQEKIAAFKQAIQQSQAQLRRYEWIETTTVMLKGEVKSQKQSRCYYGADGKVQKVEISATAAAPPSGGRLKRRVIAKKKEEMSDYMKQAVALIHRYVPPQPGMIQTAKDSGKAKYGVMEPGKVVQLDLNDIVHPGDLMTVTLDIRRNAVLDIKVSTYLDSQEDGVLLNVTFASLPDGTSYAGQTTLDAKAKDIKVVVENTGHRRVN